MKYQKKEQQEFLYLNKLITHAVGLANAIIILENI